MFPTMASSPAPSSDSTSSVRYPSPSNNMQRSNSLEQGKGSKRKGARSVSTLTPAQLARKRANDREAQRAIRARTKEHIERLEAEIEELRSERGRDPAVQELMRRNNMLEKELKNLRESMGMPFTTASHNNTSPYSAPGHLASPRTSPYPSSNDMTTAAPAAATSAPMPDYPSGYVSFGNPAPVTDAWPVAAMSGPSNVSSPCSSIADEYGAGNGYLPTSAPNPMVAPPVNNSLAGHPEDIKLEYDDGTDNGLLRTESQTSSIRSHATTPPTNAVPHPFMLQQHHQPQLSETPAWGPNPAMYYATMQQHPVY